MKLYAALLTSVLALGAVAVAPVADAAPAKKDSKTPAKTYKWVDKDGVVHYGDKIPAEYADQHKQQLNAQGQVVKEIEGAMTPEEKAAAEKRRAAEEQAKAQAANDKILLSTYGSVADLERARDTRLAALQGQVNIASSTTSDLEKEIARLEKQRASAKDPKAIERLDQQIAAQRREHIANQRHIVSRTDEMAAVRKQFDADIKRFRELQQPAKPAAAPATKR